MPSINQAVCFNCSSVEKCPYCVSCFFTLIPGSVVQLCMFIAFGYGIISSFLHAFVNQGNSLKIVCAFFTSSIISSMSYFIRSVSSKKSWGLIRGHSRNRPKGGRNSPQRYISTRFADHFSQFLFTERSKPLQGALSAAFCTKLCLIHRLILV